MGCCDSEGEVKLWECSTGVLLIGCLALLEAQRAKFLLADRAAGVVASVVQGAEFSLAAAAAFFFLLLLRRERPGSFG